MNKEAFIASGILEDFVLGLTSDKDNEDILAFAEQYPEIKNEIILLQRALESYASAHAKAPPKSVKSKILTAIEEPLEVPILSMKSKTSDYSHWLNTVTPPEEYDSMHMEVIANTEAATTVIAWVRSGEKDHIHSDYTEKFLIVEGSCHAIVNGIHADYSPGDYVEFPIHVKHSYEVTSATPMKVIACLDRSAA